MYDGLLAEKHYFTPVYGARGFYDQRDHHPNDVNCFIPFFFFFITEGIFSCLFMWQRRHGRRFSLSLAQFSSMSGVSHEDPYCPFARATSGLFRIPWRGCHAEAIYIKHFLCISKVYRAGIKFRTNLKFSGRGGGARSSVIGLPVHKKRSFHSFFCIRINR